MPTLAELITQQKRRRGFSYRTLETRADSVISAQRWQQLGTGTRINEFPEPATLQAIADALQVDIASVVLAAARSIGLEVRRKAESDLAVMLPASAARLTDEQRDAILALVRAITKEDPDASQSPTATSAQSRAPSEAPQVEKIKPAGLTDPDQGEDLAETEDELEARRNRQAEAAVKQWPAPDLQALSDGPYGRRAARRGSGPTEVERAHSEQDQVEQPTDTEHLE